MKVISGIALVALCSTAALFFSGKAIAGDPAPTPVPTCGKYDQGGFSSTATGAGFGFGITGAQAEEQASIQAIWDLQANVDNSIPGGVDCPGAEAGCEPDQVGCEQSGFYFTLEDTSVFAVSWPLPAGGYAAAARATLVTNTVVMAGCSECLAEIE